MSAFKPIIEINGVVDTKNSVFENLTNIATSSQSFLSWDPSLGQWSINLNRELAGLPGSAAKHFNDDNIIGGINVTGTGISDLYNGVRVSFPNRELRGDQDESFFEVQQSERLANETDNVMNIRYNLLHDKIQADRMAQLELKQNRVDRVIEFFTDYRAIGLKASDIITVTNDVYDFTNKAFRIASIEETDSDDGGILLKIIGIEYDVDVYNTTGLTAPERNKNTGIVPSGTNICVIEKDAEAVSNKVATGMTTPAGRNSITQNFDAGGGFSAGIPIFGTISLGITADTAGDAMGGGSASPETDYYVEWELLAPIKTMNVSWEGFQGTIIYTVDSNSKVIIAGVPTSIRLYRSSVPFTTDDRTDPSFNGVFLGSKFLEWSSYISSFNIGAQNPGYFRLYYQNLNTYDLDATSNYVDIDSVAGFITTTTIDGIGYAAGVNVQAFLA